MTGGRIGKDGIHGATFSSEELHKDSPVQAVQIGDPITQKRMGDFIYEARDKNLYRFVTDNGAGGLSSSVGEMASICGGCVMDLKKAPLKYAGMKPWEILISEAQERMSFAVPPEKIDEFMKLAADRDVEATILGKFTDDGKFRMMYGDKTVACLDIKFMHEGLPRLRLNAKWKAPKFAEPDLKGRDVEKDLLGLLAKLNICSCEYKARQYDHEVKGLSVVKPFVGRERDVQGDASVFMVEPLGREGAVLSYGILPRYSDIDCYHMMASVIDLAIRRAVAVGARVDMISGLDNFCWPDPVQSEKTPDGEYKMAQLVRANKGLYDYTCAFNVPCISGKDSMKNDSTRGGKKISIPPTVLFSTISKVEDISKCVTPDFKEAGDDVYMVGMTCPELGGSEYFDMLGATGNNVPKVNAEKALALYKAMEKMIHADIPSSIITPSSAARRRGGKSRNGRTCWTCSRPGESSAGKRHERPGSSILRIEQPFPDQLQTGKIRGTGKSSCRFPAGESRQNDRRPDSRDQRRLHGHQSQNGRHARQLQIHTRRSLILFQRFPTPFPKKRERRFYMIFSISRFSRKVEETNGCDISTVSLFIT